jgi:RND family efflux transporter MFP subunit
MLWHHRWFGFRNTPVAREELLNELRIDRSAAEPPSHARAWMYGSFALLALITLGLVVFLVKRTPALEVEVEAARAMASRPANASVLDASGYVTARRMATVSSKVTGKVAEVLIEEGQRVEADQVIARIEAIDANAQLSLAQAQLAAARSQLAEIRVQVEQAAREVKRQDELAARKLTSAQARENAQSNLASLQARLASTEAQAQVSARSVKVAEQNLDNTVVRAPFAGVVTVKAAQPGEMVSPLSAGGSFTRTGIGTIVDMDSLEIEVDVNEAFINRVTPNQPVEAVLNAYTEWKIPAYVIAVIPTADRTKATVKVRIGFREHDPRILPDMGVRVAFLEEKKPADATQAAPQGVLVSSRALASRDGKDVVFVMKNGAVERRAVTLGKTYGDARQVTAGLASGDSVVLDPPESLKEGDRVELKAKG